MIRGFVRKSAKNFKKKNKIPVAHKATACLYDGIIIPQYACKPINHSP